MAREINLVPSSKFETIKAIRIRNFLLFLCIAVAGGAIAVVFVLGTILGGQNLILGGKDDMLKLYSEKINSYGELTDFLTIKDQLGKLRTLADNKNLVSRTFNLLPVFVPTNGDEVTFSKLEIKMESNEVTIDLEAQADAKTEPFIDYNVLDAFKKSMDYYRYDYGTYVNELGDTIPSYCIIDTDENGTFLNEDGKFYAYWTVDIDGCDPKRPIDLLEDDEEDGDNGEEGEDDLEDGGSDEKSKNKEDEGDMQYSREVYAGMDVVKIWRTPQFEEWYNDEYMSLGGSIEGVPHFESSCITYSGELDENTSKPYFVTANDSCQLVVDGIDGFTIETSTNARNVDKELILSFKGSLRIDGDYYKMQKTHMMAIGPSGRYNVTDSYQQVQSLFVPPADACEIDDVECRNGGK